MIRPLPSPRPRLVTGLVAAVLAASAAAPAPAAVDPDSPTLWPEPQRAFFQDGPALLLPEEDREALLAMETDERERFIAEFLGRDPLPETSENELTEAIERRRRLALSEFDSPRDVRAQAMFLNGRPAERLVVDCNVAFRPIEIWTFVEPPSEPGAPETSGQAVFYQPDVGERWRLWRPIDSKRALYSSEMEYWLEQWEELQGNLIRAKRFDLQVCENADEVDEATGVRGLRDFQRDRPTGAEFERWLEPPADLGSWAREAAATELPELPGELRVSGVEIGFPAELGQRMITRALVTLPPDAGFEVEGGEEGEEEDATAETDEDDDEPRVHLRIEGLVEEADGQIFEDFIVRFHLPPPSGADGAEGGEGVEGEERPVVLSVERPLRPNRAFVVRLRVEDETSGATAFVSRGFAVPSEPQEELLPPVPDDVVVALGEELAGQRIEGADSLLLVPPESDVVMGLWRAEALVTGTRIEKVAFFVDGTQQLARSSPPWEVEVRLEQFPVQQVVRAEGYDASGELVASDEVVLNQPRGAFDVRIVEPARGTKATGTVLAEAEVTVPEDRTVERVEFRVGEELVATLEAPPWRATIEVPPDDEVAYLAVRAELDDGTSAEDVRFLSSPRFVEQVDVNLIELYTAVVGRDGRLVQGLGESDFEVYEDGRRQEIAKFERVDDLPLTVGITIDTSGSMTDSLGEAKAAALGFLGNVVDPAGDRTFAVAFASRAVLLTPPTEDVRAVEDLVQTLQANGWTALHDAIVTSLYYFRGVRGQKALVVLSDGDDTASSIPFRNALEYARRSGVAIYTIGLEVGRLQSGIRGKLENLARETGGRSFFISEAGELAGVYQEIEDELRSRYLLAYASDRPREGDGEFREVEVKVEGRGLKARTISGYYP